MEADSCGVKRRLYLIINLTVFWRLTLQLELWRAPDPCTHSHIFSLSLVFSTSDGARSHQKSASRDVTSITRALSPLPMISFKFKNCAFYARMMRHAKSSLRFSAAAIFSFYSEIQQASSTWKKGKGKNRNSQKGFLRPAENIFCCH